LGFRHEFPSRAKHTMFEKLGLSPIGVELHYDIDQLVGPISTRYKRFKVIRAAHLADVSEAYDPRRRQYHSSRMLVLLEGHIGKLGVDRLLGVASFDLYAPGMNFVFGEARLPGRVGVISTCRLKTQSRNQDNLFRDRVIKEAVHEIGHMVGLQHCSDARCVMHFSERLVDTDLKSSNLCSNCQSKLMIQIE
jgi:archaemetzincin